MRPFVLSLSACFLVLGAAWAQTTSRSGNAPQIPYGQSIRRFELPFYEGGVLKWRLSAALATGKSLNRAETTDMKIELYDDDKVTTTITSPKADLYSSERRMRTKNTVRIERSDLEATAQKCDFDYESKQYNLSENVRVVLKNFDASTGLGPPAKQASPGVPSAGLPAPMPLLSPAHPDDSLLNSPGAYSTGSTNTSPGAPAPNHP
jgi:hypothetical protein